MTIEFKIKDRREKGLGITVVPPYEDKYACQKGIVIALWLVFTELDIVVYL